MSTLYWINVLGNLSDVCMIIFIMSALLSLVFFIVTIFYENEIKADLSKVGYKRFVKIRNIASIAFIISTLAYVFIPSRSQLYIIYGVGETIDHLKENLAAKELPNKCIKALDTWVDNFNKEEGNND